ncbi:MAG: hypothetical protein D6707_08860 [Bacteroidetes bacterium]|nr:MAG: hypothetical protein D6707_08860 [Bacteroidota bacterium]
MKKFIFLPVLMFIFSCTGVEYVDISKVDLKISLKRFEQDLFAIPPDSMVFHVEELNRKYPDFFPVFVDKIISIGVSTDPSIGFALSHFTSDRDMRKVYQDVTAKYSDFSAYHKEIEDAFKRYTVYFPDKSVPSELITCITAFNYAIVALDSSLVIGLEMFMNKDYEYYDVVQFPMYKRKVMNEQYLVPFAVKGWVVSEFVPEQEPKDLVENMIVEGRYIYVLEKLLPYDSPYLKFGFTAEELQWCEDNEARIWAHLIEKKLLFTTDAVKIKNFMGEAPFTTGLPKESPGRVGAWLGYKIVKSFMEEKNPDLNQLMSIKDFKAIFNQSGYRPD